MNAVPPNAARRLQEKPDGPTAGPDRLLLRLDGYEGPLDLLLELARAQKIDLARISILMLAEQFLAVVEGARLVRIELRADWLVMAAFLAWLKSRLLLPEDKVDETVEADADQLAARLLDLERVRALARFLDERPVLGRDVWTRGAAENLTTIDRSGLRLELGTLVSALLGAARRRSAADRFRPARRSFPTIADALARLERFLGVASGWVDIAGLQPGAPDRDGGELAQTASVAAMFVAALELARRGACELRQDDLFAPVLLRRTDGVR